MKDMQSGCLDYNITDLWATDAPAVGLNGTGEFEEFVFRDHIVDIIQKHDPNDPLFMMYAPHVAHCPLQVPQEWFEMVRQRDEGRNLRGTSSAPSETQRPAHHFRHSLV
jgi:hypothetical protein